MKTGLTAFVLAAVLLVGANAQGPDVDRRVLIKQNVGIPGSDVVLVDGTLPVGGREALHTHLGTLVRYVLSGEIRLTQEQRAAVAYTAGESFEVRPNEVHEGISTGDTPVSVVATFIVPQDAPITTRVDSARRPTVLPADVLAHLAAPEAPRALGR